VSHFVSAITPVCFLSEFDDFFVIGSSNEFCTVYLLTHGLMTSQLCHSACCQILLYRVTSTIKCAWVLKVKFWPKTCWSVKDFHCQNTDKKICQQELEKTNFSPVLAKVANNRFSRMHSRKQPTVFISGCR